ncbi:DUF4097 family beta strand repeat-containing protein [Kribbella sp. WER1]
MTRAQRTMLLVGVLPLLVVLLAGGAGTVAAIRGKLPYSYSGEFAPGADGVQIFSDISTQVLASNDGKVHVTLDGSYTVTKPDLQVTTQGRQLLVRAMCQDTHCNIDVTVEVPAEAPVQAKVEGTSINLVGLSAPLTVHASDGSVDLARMRSPQVAVDAQRGSISMVFEAPPDRVSATSSDGSITVQLPRTTSYAIDAVAAQGSTNLSVPNDASAAHHLFLRSSYGSITVQ